MKYVIFIFLALVGPLDLSAAETFPEWDKKLPQLVLTNVDLSGESLTKTLNNIGQYLGIRIIAYITSDIGKAFAFRAQQCTVSNVLDKMAATYDSLEWNQDQKTGVIWFVPKNGEADSWLKFPVKLERAQPGLRMYTDIIDGLSRFTNRKIGTPRRGAGFLTIFDYTVDLPSGVLSLKDIINICASTDPHISFWLQPRADYAGYLVISLGTTWNNANPKTLVPGFRYFWELEVRRPTSAILRSDAIFAAYSSPDPHIRGAAEKTRSLLGYLVADDDILKTTGLEVDRMWAANGLLNAVARDPRFGKQPPLDILSSEANQARLLALDDPELVVLSAFQIARCGGGTGLLTSVLNKQIPPGKLSSVKSALFRMARESAAIRSAIKAKRPNWSDLTPDEIDQLVSPDELVFSAP